ncbi:N-acetyltransferase family protein [Rhodobacteraceae bacterium CCMM004]|nr:N-acetyltransferase family protein [Rhodobacteraceae bacterium CCMM004]
MIRDARKDDAAAVAALWNPVIRDTAITFNRVERTAGEVADLIAARHGFFVAEAEGRITGFAYYGQFRGGIGYAHTMEHTVLVDDAARGTGVGRALMRHLMDHAAARGAHSLFAGVSGENPAGVAFHARLGFEEVAVLRQVGRKFGRWMDLHLMQKHLTASQRLPDTGGQPR